MENTHKKCTKCNEVKPLDSFGNEKKGKHGKRSNCKRCNYAYNQKYREDNREKYNTYFRNYYKENKEKLNSMSRKYRQKDPEKTNSIYRKYRENNQEKIKVYCRNYYIKNKEKILFRNQKYKEKNRVELSEVYLKNELKRRGMPITPETIEIKREQVKILRLIKNQ